MANQPNPNQQRGNQNRQQWQDRIIDMFEQGRIDADQMERMLASGQTQSQSTDVVVSNPIEDIFDEVERRTKQARVKAFDENLTRMAMRRARALDPDLFEPETPATPEPTTHQEWRQVVVETKRGFMGRETHVLEWQLVDVPDDTPAQPQQPRVAGPLMLPPPRS